MRFKSGMLILRIGMSHMTIDPSLFPVPDSPYATNGIRLDKHVPLSLIAFHLNLIFAEGNAFHDQRKKGYYFFRDSSVPHPRPATQLAWERLCRLGHLRSKSFLVPFLPALREEDEAGQAIAEKGIHVASLSRRSALHRKESIKLPDGRVFDAIIWGDCYIGSLASDSQAPHTTLVGHTDRSNVSEALVLGPSDLDGSTGQESIRNRLEFLAQYGIPATNAWAKIAGIPRIHRLLFQFVKQVDASSWADSYRHASVAVRADPGIIAADYRDMLEEQRLKRQRIAEEESVKESKPEPKIEKNSTNRAGFGNLSDFSL